MGDTSDTRASVLAGSTEKMAVGATVGDKTEKAQDAQFELCKLTDSIGSGLHEHPSVVDSSPARPERVGRHLDPGTGWRCALPAKT
jgi:hypothetical protein